MRRAAFSQRPLLDIVLGNDAVTLSSATNTTQNVNRPAGAATGSFLVGWSAISSANTLNTPTGGTGPAWSGGSTSASGFGLWWKWITDISLEPPQYTFTGGTLVSRHTTIVRLENVDPTTPVAGGGAAAARNTGSGQPNSGAVTADFPGQLLLSLFCAVNSSAAVTSPPAGMTKIFENNTTQTRALAAAIAAAGSNDPGAWTIGSINYGAASLILNPARA